MSDNDNNRSKPNSLLGRVQACKLIQTNSASLTCLVEHAVVDSFLSVFFTLVGGLGGVCFETAYDSMISPIKDKRMWKARLEGAQSYSDWAEAAEQLDRIEGKQAWKDDPDSPYYDRELLESRLEQLRSARLMRDEAAMAFLLRTSIHQDFAGINNPKLYEETRIGTKRLIEEFREEVILHIRILSENIEGEANPLALRLKMDFFKELRHTLGNTALLLSGGGAIGLYHIGILKVLREERMIPRIMAGASAGSIMLGFAACADPSNWDNLIDLRHINTRFFEPDDSQSDSQASLSWINSFRRKIDNILQTGVLYDTNIIRDALRSQLGDMTFLESYRLSGLVLNVSISSTSSYDMPCLLNYLTAPNVCVWSAIVVSCSVPGVFEQSYLMAKDPEGRIVPWNVTEYRWIDGSLDHDLPMERLSELFNVTRFIVCQVNPHVNPILRHMPTAGILGKLNRSLLFLMHSELNYRLNQLESMGLFHPFCRVVKSLINQRYTGDITILPSISLADWIGLFSDWEYDRIMAGRFREMTLIKSFLATELVLDEVILRIRNCLVDVNSRLPAELSPKSPNTIYYDSSDDFMLDRRSSIYRQVAPSVSATHIFTSSNLSETSLSDASSIRRSNSLDPYSLMKSPSLSFSITDLRSHLSQANGDKSQLGAEKNHLLGSGIESMAGLTGTPIEYVEPQLENGHARS